MQQNTRQMVVQFSEVSSVRNPKNPLFSTKTGHKPIKVKKIQKFLFSP
jgi:hypothetical protein